MKTIRCGLLALAVLSMVGLGDAAEKRKKKGAGAIAPLVPQAILDSLNLTAEQKNKVGQLQDEYLVSVKKSRAEMKAEMKKTPKAKGAAKKMQASMRLAEDATRKDLEPRFEQILTAEQKKKYGELKSSIPAVSRFATGGPMTVKGTIQKLDADSGTLVLAGEGKGKLTYRVSRATKVLDAAGSELPGGLSDKALTPGAAVSLTLVKQDTRLQKPSVLEIKLAGK